MKTMLMNFGDNVRIIYNSNRKAVSIGIGQARRVDLDESTVKFLKRCQETDTLLMVPVDEEMPAEVTELLSLIEIMNTGDYHTILTRMTALIGAANMPSLQPNRHEMRNTLRDLTLILANRRAANLAEAIESQKPTPIHDDVDPKELQKELEKKAPPAQLPDADSRPPVVPLRDNLDAALGISAGGGASAPAGEGDILDPEASETDVGPSAAELAAEETQELAQVRARMEASTERDARKSKKTGRR
jgi:hypothetical protein